ncbi:histidine--tRNA ligase [Afifella sp. IM 167]|uniref:histidine--tRNA ligase n=1 Tax=Afifella sp. IM 167 TaxID=2033586 RepID=UPI001CCB8BB5|nr:histidine--tRNA ligase [Afifella sp. IM 167]MBZ8133497.1 histidine--tRNA ligase [Afifella sp. IM 167]
MAEKTKRNRLTPRLPRGFVDREAGDIRASEEMLAAIRRVYERYGFEPVETPFFEYTEALGKFLPDQDRPNEGVFSLQDDDEAWLSLRYDLTAPLARYVAENYERLPKPYRSYRAGWVFRNEKPGPGRFRQFMQFDADTVGTPPGPAGVAADAEICMMAADVMEALGIARGDYVIKVNNRKVLDGIMEAIGLGGEENAGRRLTVLRAIDKLDRLGIEGVRELLGEGRKDESGDFTKGAGLGTDQVATLMEFLERAFKAAADVNATVASGVAFNNEIDQAYFLQPGTGSFYDSDLCVEGHNELEGIRGLVRAAGYGMDRIQIDPSVVRGLEYYTGPVFEAQLTFEVPNEKGEPVVFGSVGGGGRYDGLVGRFRGEDTPATGFSLGVSRLASALKNLGKLGAGEETGPVVVTVMDKSRLADYQKITADLRAGLNAEGGPVVPVEMYLGGSGMKAQLKYADRRNAPCAVIAGSDEFDAGKVQVKDLLEGKRRAAAFDSHEDYKDERPGQFEVARGDLVEEVRALLARQRGAS